MTTPILSLRGVERSFGGVSAVRNIDLDVAEGEHRAILGPNGAGKTTLFNLISGELPVSAGRIGMFGRDVTHLPSRKRAKAGLARTFQTSKLFLRLSVEDNLFLAILGVDGRYMNPIRGTRRERRLRSRARAAAELVGLTAQLETVVGSLSYGEQRQLEVAMAAARQPRLMMLDEPAAGLSPGERDSLAELLLNLGSAVTLVLIEHDVELAFRMVGRVTVMHEGSIVADGTPDEIRRNETVHEIYLGTAIGG